MFYVHTYRHGRLLLGNMTHVAGAWRDLRTVDGAVRRVRQDRRGRPGDRVEIEQVSDERPYGEGRIAAVVQL